jgi:glycosyltransferase involved in cell wall biosynthesis
VRRLAILCNESAGRVDAIREHSFLLADAIRRQGTGVDVCLRRPGADWSVADDVDLASNSARPFDAAQYEAVVLQYNPFLFGRWGFAPWLPIKLFRWKIGRRARIVLMVHEPYVPMLDWKWVLMGTWQRAQLSATRLAADIVLASIEATTEKLRSKWPSRPTHHLPVGSTLPNSRDDATELRDRLELDSESLVVAVFGTDHPSRLPGLVAGAVNAVAEEVDDVVFFNLGANAAKPRGVRSGVRVYQPGYLSDADVSDCLGVADVFLAPFADGVSSRRSSLMAALQHSLAVVGTDGHLTDGLLRRSGAMRLVPVGRHDLFAQAAVDLATSPAARRTLGESARALYESSFDWPVLARRLLDTLAG